VTAVVREPLTFVSVVFEEEYRLLELQARSMGMFLDPAAVAEIIVIDNSAGGMPGRVRADVVAGYDGLADAVRVLRPRDITRVPGTIGWRAQQVLKLSVAHRVSTARYVVLDAKNHLIDAAGAALFVAPDGRPRVTAHGYERHALRPMIEHVLKYLGLDPTEHVERFTATITPFTFDTSLVAAMLRDIERRSGRPFAEEFVANDLTEFFLYTGWLIAGGRSLDDVYDIHQAPWPVVWPGSANRGGVEDAIARADERRSPGFAVHRKALAHLDGENAKTVARFWTDKHLFSSVGEAERFIADHAHAYRRARVRKQVRELPHRARRVPRQMRERLRAAGLAARPPLSRTAGNGVEDASHP
jgi:hypothetical protein